jgi:hypothetical protein
MHPIFERGHRLALYLASWLALGVLLAMVLVRPGGLRAPEALVLVLPVAAFYGFVCLSAWFVCRATPLRTSSGSGVLANIGGATVAASFILVAAARSWGLALSRLRGFAAGMSVFDRATLLLIVLGAVLYLGMVAVHYLLLAAGESRASEQRALELELQAREAELKALRAQIEPHFLFNSLNSISALAVPDPHGARRMCVLLGDFLRSTVRLGLQDRVPLADELSMIERFFEIEQVRFGQRLAFERSVEPGLESCLVPPLLLQPLAENAVGHGIAHLVEGGTISLSVAGQDGRLRITVRNPVDPDRPRRPRTGVGLANVRRRLATHYGGQASLEFSEAGDTVYVTITLPCAKA